jgi:predicted alpha/beta superfamily hydrolase
MLPRTAKLFLFFALAGWCGVARAASVDIVVHVPADTPPADSVYVAGSLPSVGGWAADGLKLARQADGTFSAAVDLSPGQQLEFKITRGSWETVEKNADGSERANRIITAESAGQTINVTVARWAGGGAAATRRAGSVVGDLRVLTIDSQILHQNRTLRVWLPAGYDANPTARFDVLYMQDGQNCFDRATSAFGNEWQIDETLTALIAPKRIAPLIVVGIDHGGKSRLNEYTFEPDPDDGGGQGAAYADFLLGEVKPLVEKKFRTLGGRQHTFIGGSSLGGLVSLEIARRHAGVFGGVLAMSPSLWWDGQQLTQEVERDPGGLAGMRVWIDIGSHEGLAAATRPADDHSQRYIDNTRRFDAALTRHGIEHRLVIDNVHTAHNELAWASRFPQAIQYLLGPPR